MEPWIAPDELYWTNFLVVFLLYKKKKVPFYFSFLGEGCLAVLLRKCFVDFETSADFLSAWKEIADDWISFSEWTYPLSEVHPTNTNFQPCNKPWLHEDYDCCGNWKSVTCPVLSSPVLSKCQLWHYIYFLVTHQQCIGDDWSEAVSPLLL